MYLKSLELFGFKSFAEKTRLEFGQGLTAIVGPNGCGKSNVSDAVRWVIGEQSAKALRGAKMEDCIFNGTDDRKPLGMAEVSLTLAECEGLSDLDYHEVTVTRRVFRSGEGQYFLNKNPCRLKDIQRLFMDTGMGANSYSLMEQGRIDQVLSSRPEDRRAIFEQASGITKYKSDKKEAMRKLEQTEANLARLADVIREVKRQIGSLQRQAGKARRYKQLKERLRTLDLAVARDRLQALETEMREMDARRTAARADVQEAVAAVTAEEQETARLREAVAGKEREATAALEAGMQARSNLEHTREMIEVNRRRIQEYRTLSERDTREIQTLQEHRAETGRQVEQLAAALEAKRAERTQAEQRLQAETATLQQTRTELEQARAALRQWREEAVDQENQISRWRNQLMEMESRERSAVIQREKLQAEQARLGREATAYEQRLDAARQELEAMRAQDEAQETRLAQQEQTRTEADQHVQTLRQKESDLKSAQAAKSAQVDFLREAQAAARGFSPGARLALDESNPLQIDRSRIYGALAAAVEAPADFQIPLQAVLRTWTDAVLVHDRATALEVLARLRERKDGAVRLLAVAQEGGDGAGSEPLPAGPGACRLLDQVTVTKDVRPLFERILGRVLVVEGLDRVPAALPVDAVFVTADGLVVRGDGSFEVWKPDSGEEDPLSRKQALDAAERNLNALQTEIDAHAGRLDRAGQDVRAAEQALMEGRQKRDEIRRAMAQKEGEFQVVSAEAREARERLETVADELSNLGGPADRESGAEKERLAGQIDELHRNREQLAGKIEEQGETVHALENRQTEIQTRENEVRVQVAEMAQQLDHEQSRHDYLRNRIHEIDSSLSGRQEGVDSWQNSVHELEASVQQAAARMVDLQAEDRQAGTQAEARKAEAARQAGALAQMEKSLAARRVALDELKSQDNELEVHLAENRMRKQNLIERVTSAYGISSDRIFSETPPADETQDTEAMETEIAELRTKLDGMGAVNLVAIEELRELEERHTFLSAQEEDLVKGREQLLDMIRTINRTTSEMFRRTFDQINANFEVMFKKMFQGGTAKLVLVNEEDILESGIEIIARPPGKRLQNIGLLSGGERTLTAVALLFAIYMCKPSPFCLLDEIDAALDESNIKRFVLALQDFLLQSQFIVITHNRQTISAANTLYGVTMPRKGVSSLMSMKFSDVEQSEAMGVT